MGTSRIVTLRTWCNACRTRYSTLGEIGFDASSHRFQIYKMVVSLTHGFWKFPILSVRANLAFLLQYNTR